ncbi:MAG: M16 family metallopeptidase [Plesiomonas sp.]|uniref:M16 family metallopeptidase n=1 Tax=Plesiomonas sp. TaxID=2486279 RepID=UPI003F3A956D
MVQGCVLRRASCLRGGSMLLSMLLLSYMLLSYNVGATNALSVATEKKPLVGSELRHSNHSSPPSVLSSPAPSSLPTENTAQLKQCLSLWQITPALSDTAFSQQYAQIMAIPEQVGELKEQQQFPQWNITQATFHNGLAVLIKQMDVVPDRVYIQLRARGGMRSLPPELLAAAKLLSLKMNADEQIDLHQNDFLHNFIVQNGIKLQPIITASQHGISGSVEKTHLDTWFALARQILVAPFFSETLLYRVQTQEARAISQYLQTPKGLFQSHLQQYLFPNNPYVRFSSPRDVQNVSVKQLNAVHTQLRNALQDAELVIVGNVDPQQVLTLVGNYFGGLDLGSKPYWNSYPFLLKKSAPLIEAHNPDDRALVVITRLSVPAITDDVEHRLAHKMLQYILQQRMRQALRATGGEAVHVTVDMTYPATDMQMNMLQIRATVPAEQYAEAEMILKKQLNLLLVEGFSAKEMDTAKQQVNQQIMALWQDPKRSTQTLSTYWLAGYPIEDIMQMPTLLAGISEQVLRDLTLHYLNAPGQLTAGFLPKSVFQDAAQ